MWLTWVYGYVASIVRVCAFRITVCLAYLVPICLAELYVVCMTRQRCALVQHATRVLFVRDCVVHMCAWVMTVVALCHPRFGLHVLCLVMPNTRGVLAFVLAVVAPLPVC